MGKCIIMTGTAGGIDPDELTAVMGDVLKGKIAGIQGNDEPVMGTLELTGNAADSQILAGQTYYNTDPKTKRTGTMVNRGALSTALNAGGSYTIPAGFHNGSGKVTANGLSGQTSATAAAWHILSGQTAWVNGNKVTGSMANQGTKTASLNCGSSYTIPAGYHNGSGKVTANSLSSQTGGATADDSKVLSGYTYWKDGAKRTGNLTVSSVVSFNAAQYSNLTLIASWAKPSKGPWSGVRIMCKQGSYPSSVSDGTLFYEGSGTSATKSLAAGTWYFRAWNYITASLGRIYGGYSQVTCTNNQIKGTKTFTSSSTFTVPQNVRSVDIFCVGGGGGGGNGNRGSDSNGSYSYVCGGGGGGGGFTSTVRDIMVSPGDTLLISIGVGGAGGYNSKDGKAGNPTIVTKNGIQIASANGGNGGTTRNPDKSPSRGGYGGNGGSGGSGGGGDYTSNGNRNVAGVAGHDGDDAVYIPRDYWGGIPDGGVSGTGQQKTTRAFEEANGTLYASGGEGVNLGDKIIGQNGSSGSGNGGCGYDLQGTGGTGGSGITIIRWGYL